MRPLFCAALASSLFLTACATTAREQPSPPAAGQPSTQAPAAVPQGTPARPDWVLPPTGQPSPVTPPTAAPPPPAAPPVAPPPPAAPAPATTANGTPAAAGLKTLAFGRADFAAVPGWSSLDPGAARRAFVRSCAVLMARPADSLLSAQVRYSGRVQDWQNVCRRASDAALSDRSFWETSFQPWVLQTTDSDPGHLTAYFEPVMRVSPNRTGTHVEPIQAPPADIVEIDPKLFEPNSIARVWYGRVVDGQLRPYLTRAEIGPQTAPVLAWGDMGEVMSLQIQGSGRLVYDDGRQVRAAFAAHNGHPFGSVAREMIRRGILSANGASADAITNWMRTADPAEARSVMNANPRTVFFRLEPITDPSVGPRGAMGVPLEASGAIAVDPAYHAYGVPFVLDASSARLANSPDQTFQRLVISQDTGGAIRGPLRADFYWGTGPEAGLRAGRVNHAARWWVLLPVGLDPVAAAAAR